MDAPSVLAIQKNVGGSTEPSGWNPSSSTRLMAPVNSNLTYALLASSTAFAPVKVARTLPSSHPLGSSCFTPFFSTFMSTMVQQVWIRTAEAATCAINWRARVLPDKRGHLPSGGSILVFRVIPFLFRQDRTGAKETAADSRTIVHSGSPITRAMVEMARHCAIAFSQACCSAVFLPWSVWLS